VFAVLMLQRRISDTDAAEAFGEIVKRLLDAKLTTLRQ
jgi:hypothetical protein